MIKKGLAEKNSTSQTSPSVIKQKSSGTNSPNINAPDAKTIHINYGIPENVFNDWVTELKGDKGKDNVIEYLLKDLKQKDLTLSEMQTKIEDALKMRKELEKRLAEKSFVTTKVKPLSKFTHQEFIDSFVIFRSYYQYRKTLELLSPEMLIELLKVYFRSVLLYPSSEMKRYVITDSNGSLLQLQIQGYDETGNLLPISLPALSSSLLRDVCSDFIKSANIENYETLLHLFDRALLTPELDKNHKSNILDAQTFIKKSRLNS